MSTPAQTPEGVQDPSPTPEVTPEPAPPTPTGPWANELASHFEDPAQRAAVDAFLRETVQPHVTRIEQERASLKDAEALYSDLVANPNETFLAIAEELYTEDGAKAIQEQLTNLFGQQEETPVTEPTNPPPSLDPEDKQAIEWAKQQATTQAYNAELERVKAANPDVDAEDWELFHPFVASAAGDFDAATNGFKEYLSRVEQRYAPPAPEGEPDPAAPATLGTEAAQTVPPTEKNYGSDIEAALDDFFAEQRAGAPPVVGSV